MRTARWRVCCCTDAETGADFQVRSRCVINATGVWVDALRQQDGCEPRGRRRPTRPMVAPSQGVHLVVDREFLAGDTALMVPKTADGRVLFAVPWLGKVILGTTDTPREDLAREPRPFKEEVAFILSRRPAT
jgi:glycerol-3-phosphate dehydrogenase